MEGTLQSFIKKQEAVITQTNQRFASLEDTFAKIASTLNVHEKGKFSSQPQLNPKSQGNSGEPFMDQVKPIMTLHDGKVIDKPHLELRKENEETSSKGKDWDEPILMKTIITLLSHLFFLKHWSNQGKSKF